MQSVALTVFLHVFDQILRSFIQEEVRQQRVAYGPIRASVSNKGNGGGNS